MAKRTGRAKPMSPKAGIKRGRYGNGGKLNLYIRQILLLYYYKKLIYVLV